MFIVTIPTVKSTQYVSVW